MIEKINIIRLKIDGTDVFIEDLGDGKGKVTISNIYGHNYSHYWGAMGSNILDFIIRINSEYFADKLLGYVSMYSYDDRKTFANLRKHIQNEILPWYKHLEFQSDMRQKLNEFQSECNTENDFVDKFQYFINGLDYYLISDRFDRESIESEFKSISEPWGFLGDKPSDKYLWLINLHKKIIKKLKKM